MNVPIASRARYVGAIMSIALCAAGFSPGISQAAVSNWQKGVTVYPDSQTDYSSDGFKQTVAHMKSLGVNYITLAIPYYQSNVGSTDIGRGWNTPTDDSLVAGIQYVHSLGLHVMLKLQLDSYDGQWRANVNPSDRAAWYANYAGVLLYYAKIAQQQGVEEYCIGAELIDMASAAVNGDNTAEWENMISQVRAVYSGSLTYSANWGGGTFGDEADHIGFFGSLDSVGISAYYGLNAAGDVSSLEGAWDQWNKSTIQPLSERWGKPVLFTEIGYKSVSGAHYEPWNSGLGGSYDPTEQANDYQALFSYWNNQPFMEGVQLWDVYANPSAGGSGNTDYTPQNKPAEQAMAQWFTAPPPSGGGGGGQVQISAQGDAVPPSASPGQSVSLAVSVADSGAALSGANVDMEVYNGGGRVFQKVFSGQDFAQGQTRSFAANWTPSASGTYILKIGIFSSDWSTLYTWNNNAAQVAVSGSSVGSHAIDVWWPTNGAHVSGSQPFKALLENTPLSQYALYWQVDGGGLVPMYDNAQAWPHKEASVDLSGWNWRGNGPYTVTFVAKDASGNIVATTSVQIWVFN